MNKDNLELLYRKINRNIERKGYGVVEGPIDTTEDTFSNEDLAIALGANYKKIIVPTYFFTVGLPKLGLPNLIIIGHPAGLGDYLIDDVARYFKTEPDLAYDGCVLTKPLKTSITLKNFDVNRFSAYLEVAHDFDPCSKFLQIVLPDYDGSYTEEYLKMQQFEPLD